jgi:hypothetical protein
VIVERVKPVGVRVPDRALLSAIVRWRHVDAVALGAFVLCVTGLNQLWVSLEQRPPHWDEARHLTASLQYKEAFASGFHWLTDYHTYPPLVYWVADFFYAVLGTSAAWAAILSQAVFLAILTFATYGIGKRLWSRRVGLVAAVVAVTSPMLVSQFKDFMLDAPLTALTALALYFLVRCDCFANRGTSALFGVACGLGLLTKWNFALYVALPAGFAVTSAVRRALGSRSGARIANVVLAALPAFALCAPWYIPNFSHVRAELFGGGQANSASIYGIPPVLSLDGFLWYFWNLVSNQLYLFPFLLLVVGAVLLFRGPEARAKNRLLTLTVVGSYVLSTALTNKDDRYTLPMIPAVAVLATYWLDGLRPRARNWLVGVIVAYGFFTFAATSFGVSLLPRDIFVHLGKGCRTYPYFIGRCPGSHLVSGTFTYKPSGEAVTLRGVRIWSQNGFIDGPPSGERWYQEEMFQTAARLSHSRTLSIVGPSFDFIWFNGFATQYFSKKYGITTVATPDQADVAAVWNEPGDSRPAPVGFRQLRVYPLPNGGTLRMYTRPSISPAPAQSNPPGRTGPVGLSASGLSSMSRTLGRPIYWAGEKPGYTYEVTQPSSGAVFVRYLPPGVRVGDRGSGFLIVVTYPLGDAYAALQRAAKAQPGRIYRLPGEGLVFVARSYPRSAHVAFPNVKYQVEVYDRSPAAALAVARSGNVRPVP